MDNSTLQIRCVDLRSRDNEIVPPNIVDPQGDEIWKWFLGHTDVAAAQARILCVRIEDRNALREALEDLDAIFPDDVLKHAIWRPAFYQALARNAAGGAAGLLDSPACFILQTPLDDGPFCSMALMPRHHVAKGICIYDSDIFDPATMSGGETSRSGWRSSGLQIITLPEMLLQAHSSYTSHLLPKITAKVAGVESILASSSVSSSNHNHAEFDTLTQTLHTCHNDLINLERRSRFEETIISAIETITASDRQGTVPWPSLSPQKQTTTSRKFDFESLPRRIENCRATMNSLMQRRTEQLNLELAQASHRIAEAALKDNKSMKTIAILTMVLLPGTAVASLFSMGLFDWTAENGGEIASKWLWVYFVVALPLTGFTLVIWWIWTKGKRRKVVMRMRDGGKLLWAKEEEEEDVGG